MDGINYGLVYVKEGFGEFVSWSSRIRRSGVCCDCCGSLAFDGRMWIDWKECCVGVIFFS